jgi:cellulose synthase/poly-beta-1,6-N-acetylglucosamine synthase-like glycosyltransferase
MKLLFYLSLLLILYTYAGYPLAIAALARLRPKSWRKSPWPRLDPKPVSIIMAVHNGARMLPAQLNHLLTLNPELVHEVIVVSDGSRGQSSSPNTPASPPP